MATATVTLTNQESNVADLLRNTGIGKAAPEDSNLTVDEFVSFIVSSYLANQRANIVSQRRQSLTEAEIDQVKGDSIDTMESL
jgi:hypothetical protein